MAIAGLMVGSTPFVVAVAVAMAIVQAADAVIGKLIGDRLKTFGPAATAAANPAALTWLLMTV